VAVGGAGVAGGSLTTAATIGAEVGVEVEVGGIGVAVGGSGVAVGGSGVAVTSAVGSAVGSSGTTSGSGTISGSGTGVLVAVGGMGVFVGGGGIGVFVGGSGVAVGGSGSGVLVGGTGVAVGGSGTGVFVGGTGVAVGGSGVFVGGTGVSVGGTGVGVEVGSFGFGVGVFVGSFGFVVGVGVWVGGSFGFVVGVGVAVGSFCGRGLQFGRATEPAHGSTGWLTTGPLLPGFGSCDGLTTARPSGWLDADGSAAKAAPTGFASPRASRTAPVASHGISERRRIFPVLALMVFTRPVSANSGSDPRASGRTSSLRRPDISVMSGGRRERCSLANSSPKRAARRRPGACGGAG
jgi:hypothetical protein